MREIKFRLWDEFNKYMDYEVYGMGGQGDYCVDINDFLKKHSDFLMQYSGLKDINGREIYEGDIIKIPYCDKPLFVTYEEGSFIAEFTSGNFHELGENYSGCEVIGNIYEHSHLLEDNQ